MTYFYTNRTSWNATQLSFAAPGTQYAFKPSSTTLRFSFQATCTYRKTTKTVTAAKTFTVPS